jgi:signal transduction histidine kinase
MHAISDLIAREQDAIMARWMEQARHAASARGLDQPALTNIMPRYLASLAAGEDGSEHVERHFAARLRQGFQLAEIVEEFTLLGRCIAERSFAGPAELAPDASEIDRLYARLHRASVLVVEMFDAHMRQDEQIEKRYQRRLRSVASAALHVGSPALKTGLQELLDLVMEAMGAQSAAVLLRTGETDLVTVATAGAQPLEEYATRMGKGSFAAMVAESERPMSLWDVSSTELEVPDALRTSGIQALLGVQLGSRSGVSGIMYVGIAEARAFTARESRRLEVLAEQLVTHLDTAVLFDRLTATIERLRKEQSIREHFVAVLAHDLRGPLSAAKLGAELLSREPESLDARRDLAVRIDRNLDRLDRMIRDLLDANRIRAGERLPLRLDTCDLAQIAHEVAEKLCMLHGDRFVVEADPRALGVWSADELHRALFNLGVNAVKYGAPDRPIKFSVRRADGRVLASVHNWGAPISPEDQAQLFEPFTRTTAAIDGGCAGCGIGLTLVRGCVEAHGGAVSATSTAAEGTTFTLDIPLDARPYQAASETPLEPPPLSAQGRSTRGAALAPRQ